MSTCFALPQEFDEFAAAAASPSPLATDALDSIERWVRASAAHANAIADAFLSLAETGAAQIGDGFYSDPLTEACDPPELLERIWQIAAAHVRRDFILPTGVEIRDVNSWLREVFGVQEITIDCLTAFSAQRIREHFQQTVGDVREATIAQLRDKVLADLGPRREPAESMSLPCDLHSQVHGHRTLMQRYSGKEPHSRMERLCRYVVHLATGAHPSEVELPCFYGFNDGEPYYERARLFRVQRNPLPGVLALRFTAADRMEIRFSPKVAAALGSQWRAAAGRSWRT